jgi:hypothetical protein
MRCNVDLLKIIQIGLTLSDEDGNYPQDVSTWQFNFHFSVKCVFFTFPPPHPQPSLALRGRSKGGDMRLLIAGPPAKTCSRRNPSSSCKSLASIFNDTRKLGYFQTISPSS